MYTIQIERTEEQKKAKQQQKKTTRKQQNKQNYMIQYTWLKDIISCLKPSKSANVLLVEKNIEP